MLAQGALNSLLYSKTLMLSPQAKSTTEGGKVNSLFSADSAQAIYVWEYAFNLCMVPVVLGVGFYLLYGMVGSAMFYGLAGIGIMLCLIVCLALPCLAFLCLVACVAFALLCFAGFALLRFALRCLSNRFALLCLIRCFVLLGWLLGVALLCSALLCFV